MRLLFLGITVITGFALLACGGTNPPVPVQKGLVFNEVVAQNEGVYVDEQGELDDWIELANDSDIAVNLSDFTIADGSSERIALPNITLQPKAVIVLWADDSPEQGAIHLPFKISSGGETLTLYNHQQEVVAQVAVPALAENQAYARFPSATGNFSVCRYTSPNKPNADSCKGVSAPTVDDNITFKPFNKSEWPATVVPKSLAINELALLPARFIEVKNYGASPIDLNNYRLVIGAMNANSALPPWSANAAIKLPNITLAANAVASVALTDAHTEALYLQPFNEGAVVLYSAVGNTHAVIDQVPFMHWPTNNALARNTQFPFGFQFCQNHTQDAPNDCTPLPSRQLGNRSRGLYTPGDFAALADGDGLANIASVKFVMDLQRNNAMHYLSTARWPLHYTFVREVINQEAALNRCDPFEEQQFNQGWAQFSNENYFNTETRRYHLGTLSTHANANIQAVEFTFGDAITANQMRDAFYATTARTQVASAWTLRPQDAQQVAKVRAIEGQLPIVGPNAPFQNIVMQTLAQGVAYGTLQFITAEELENALLGPRVVVITNDVPNDIDFVGGLITEAFQTPLAHVNILSQGRGTPNLALPNAHTNPEIAPLLNKLVRFEVSAGGYNLRAATVAEAEAFWAEHGQNPEVLTPRLDATTQGLIDLTSVNIEALPTIGAKAAQLAELFRVNTVSSSCAIDGQFAVPDGAFAIPMFYYLEHFVASGAKAYLTSEMARDMFASDIAYRRIVLSTAQQMILQHPVNATLLANVEARVLALYGKERARFRSSSNTEDLSTFNGAGLYDSLSAAIGDKDRRVDDAIRTVWASLWNIRAFEERSYANVDQTQVAMAVLVHSAFRNERANGVAIARNILDPTRTDQYYFNSQAGEASVTNPAPGVITEQLVYQWPPRTPTITYHSKSSLTSGAVITSGEVRTLACAMSAIQNHFRPLLDPTKENRWFTMETEFKFLGAERQLLIKQARPYPLGHLNIANDCREI